MQHIKFRENRPACCKIGQGHPMVIILSNYDGLECQIQHIKFRENLPAGSFECFLPYMGVAAILDM